MAASSSSASSSSTQQSDGATTFQVCKNMIVDSTPWIGVGASIGLLAYAASYFKQVYTRSNDEKKIPRYLESCKFIQGDSYMEIPLATIYQYAKISPSWMSNYTAYVDAICRAWYTASSYLDRANTSLQRVCDSNEANNIVFEIRKRFNSRSANQSNQQSPSSPHHHQQQQHHQQPGEESSDHMLSHLCNLTDAQLNKMASFEILREVTDEILKILLLMDQLLEFTLAQRVNLSAMSALLHTTTILYAEYWEQVGPIFMADPAQMIDSDAEASVVIKHNLVEYLMTQKKLPVTLPNIADNDWSREHIEWWTRGHATCLPTQSSVASTLGFYSIYNPEYKRIVTYGVAPPNNSTDAANRAASHEAWQHKHQSRPNESGGGGSYEPGQTFTVGNSEEFSKLSGEKREAHAKRDAEYSKRVKKLQPATTSKSATKRNGNDNDNDMDGDNGGDSGSTRREPRSAHHQVLHIDRPTNDSSIADKIKFWQKRVESEGFAAVWKRPHAGFVPSVNEPSFLPTIAVKPKVVAGTLRMMVSSVTSKVQGIVQMQKDLTKIFTSIENKLMTREMEMVESSVPADPSSATHSKPIVGLGFDAPNVQFPTQWWQEAQRSQLMQHDNQQAPSSEQKPATAQATSQTSKSATTTTAADNSSSRTKVRKQLIKQHQKRSQQIYDDTEKFSARRKSQTQT